nr:sensor histidine kinase [Lysinibacter cavernae]
MVGALTLALYVDAGRQAEQNAMERMRSLAASLAVNPFVIDAVQSPNPTALLQPYAVDVMDSAHADFVTIMQTDRTRFTHRYPSEIGGTFAGSIDDALAGRTVNQMQDGPLGPTIRGIAPIYSNDGRIVAVVSTGVTVENNNSQLLERLPLIIAIAATLLAGGAIVAVGLRRYLQRVTFGRGPEEIGQMYAFYDAVLHSIDDGMLLLSPGGELVLHNDRAAELLGLTLREGVSAEHSAATGQLPSELVSLLASGKTVENEVVLVGDRVLLVSQRAARTGGKAGSSLGTLVILRDRTDLRKLSSELDTVHTMADALRSQTHEHANRLHTMVTLVELGKGDEAVRFATDDLAQGQRLTDRVMESVDEPVLSALLVGKTAQADERGIELSIVTEGRIPSGLIDVHDAVTILGNLIDNALDAVAEQASPDDRWVEIELIASATELVLTVIDGGPGLRGVSPDDILRRGYTSKPGNGFGRGVGLALVTQAVRRSRGTLSVQDRATASEGARFTVVLPITSDANLNGNTAPVTPTPDRKAPQ